MPTPLASGTPERAASVRPLVGDFLTSLVDSTNAQFAYFVPLDRDVAVAPVHSHPDESPAAIDPAALDGIVRQWLAGGRGKTIRLTINDKTVVDVAAVRSASGEPRGTLLLARSVGKHADPTSEHDQLELAAALLATMLASPPAASGRQALIDWASTHIGARTAFAVSVDRLNVTNDVLGYRAGDAALRALVERVEQWAGSNGRIARAGGARYLVIRTDLSDSTTALFAAEQLRGLLAEPVDLGALSVSRSASIGVAVDELGTIEPARLLRQAVRSGAAARAAGGDAVWLFDSAAASARLDRQRLELELHEALSTGQLRMHYQPEHDLRTGRLVAVEALLRWQHPELGLVGAEAFVPEAEQTHTFAAVQHWVIEQACDQLARWQDAGIAGGVLMRVNVAARNIIRDDITAVLIRSLARHQLRGDQLCVEVTERRMPADLGFLAAELAGWRERGITVALDDFGTGQGTLSHLLSLPVDVIKIDQTFVGRMRSDARAAAIVTSLTRLAHGLQLGVVAEGVDGPDTAAALVAIGCYRGQGNGLAAAMPPEHIAELLRAQEVDRRGPSSDLQAAD